MNTSLATSVKQASPPDSAMRTGVVESVSGSVVTVDVAGSSVPVSVLDTTPPATGDTVVLMRTDATWMMLGRPTAGVSGLVASGSLLGGLLLTTSDTKISGAGAEAAVPDYSITVPTPDSNLIHILATFFYASSVAGDLITVRIRQTDLTGVIYAATPLYVTYAGSAEIGQVEGWFQGQGGSSTFIVTAERTSGSGACSITTDLTNPSIFLAEKVGSDQGLTVI